MAITECIKRRSHSLTRKCLTSVHPRFLSRRLTCRARGLYKCPTGRTSFPRPGRSLRTTSAAHRHQQ
ncbi:hypothetical protein ACLKA6_019788 [Drosophila palustris]